MADVLELLIAERDKLNAAIAALGGPRRRGRPPSAGNPVATPKKAAKGGRKKMSPAERQAASERMKKIWAKRKRADKKKAAEG